VHEPLVQTQVIPYLRELVKSGHEISLVTFERQIAELESCGVAQLKEELGRQGIDWFWLKYHKRFSALATAWDILSGAWFIRQFIERKKPDILHGRVHVPTLMAALARKFSRHKPKLLFDIRGFFPEEYTDAGVWPEGGLLYRGTKRVERWLLKESDGFVVLTEKARDILFPESAGSGYDLRGRPVEVIPCCVDLEGRFLKDDAGRRDRAREELGLADRFVITHVGALGGLYMNEELADFLKVARSIDQSLFAVFLTQSDPIQIAPLLRERGFHDSDFLVKKVPSGEVPKYLDASDVGLSFVKAGYATQSRSPTKIPEYLASGIPIIANRGVGDVDRLVEDKNVGALVRDFSSSEYASALSRIAEISDISARCRNAARSEFDLQSVGGKRYTKIYRRLLRNGE
jgi:glycosyltransferase involved in cell wall biosynthesis